VLQTRIISRLIAIVLYIPGLSEDRLSMSNALQMLSQHAQFFAPLNQAFHFNRSTPKMSTPPNALFPMITSITPLMALNSFPFTGYHSLRVFINLRPNTLNLLSVHLCHLAIFCRALESLCTETPVDICFSAIAHSDCFPHKTARVALIKDRHDFFAGCN
jgi:hypothetical protein